MRVFVCLLSAFALCQGIHFTITLRLQFTMATGHYCQQVHTSTATHTISVCLTEELCGYEICAYITLTWSCLQCLHYGSCKYHVSGSVLCFLSRNKYKVNTRTNINKITLQQFTANQSTCRHLHYLTHKHTFRRGASGNTVTVTEGKTMYVLAKLIASTNNFRIISRKIEILSKKKGEQRNLYLIPLHCSRGREQIAWLLQHFSFNNMCKISKEKHKGHSWGPDSTYYTIFKRHHLTHRHTHKNTQKSTHKHKYKI